jgi:hypothetical protein
MGMVHIFLEGNKTCLSIVLNMVTHYNPYIGKVLSLSKQHLGRKEIVQWPKEI